MMSFIDAREFGSRHGSGYLTYKEEDKTRRERLQHIAVERLRLDNDPFFKKHSKGTIECSICCTLHVSEANYLNHTQGKRHMMKLALKYTPKLTTTFHTNPKQPQIKSKCLSPGFKIIKKLEKDTNTAILSFLLCYDDIATGTEPDYTILIKEKERSEKTIAHAAYIVFTVDCYEKVGFKIPFSAYDNSINSDSTIKSENDITSHSKIEYSIKYSFSEWDLLNKRFSLNIYYQTHKFKATRISAKY